MTLALILGGIGLASVWADFTVQGPERLVLLVLLVGGAVLASPRDTLRGFGALTIVGFGLGWATAVALIVRARIADPIDAGASPASIWAGQVAVALLALLALVVGGTARR